MESEASQNNIHYFENVGHIISLKRALLFLGQNWALRVRKIQFC
jgi:hypothetical protein